MSWIKTILRETYGLFVDDVSFSIALLLWLAAWFAIRYFAVSCPSWILAVALFAGLAAILFQSVLRYARTHRSG